MKKIAVLTLLISSPALAVCDGERNDYNSMKGTCDHLSALSAAASVAGGIFLGPFGGLIGAGPGAAAKAACDSADRRRGNLERCEAGAVQAAADEAERVRLVAVRAQEEADRQERRKKSIESLNHFYDGLRADVDKEYKRALEATMRSFINEGLDINSPEMVPVIAAARKNLDEQLEVEYQYVENNRTKSLSRH